MEFSEAAIDEFIAIYERTFKETISREDAIDMARRLVHLYQHWLRPLPGESDTGPE
jgi:hypothetical protein